MVMGKTSKLHDKLSDLAVYCLPYPSPSWKFQRPGCFWWASSGTPQTCPSRGRAVPEGLPPAESAVHTSSAALVSLLVASFSRSSWSLCPRRRSPSAEPSLPPSAEARAACAEEASRIAVVGVGGDGRPIRLQFWWMCVHMYVCIVVLTASLASYSSVICFSLVANLHTMKVKSKLKKHVHKSQRITTTYLYCYSLSILAEWLVLYIIVPYST